MPTLSLKIESPQLKRINKFMCVKYYKYKAIVCLAIAKPFGWINNLFHDKHVEALRKYQRCITPDK
jgi:hypothetical protein